ncbi:CaiD Enoyl-CoA hydratase/carnithine racemase [Candidatus Planktophila dulcis]|uniref:enoyl-CoA hydratase n=1 Tax=Candidatus Planktophila dulcis TaxID=1884914 RepID=UPI003CFB982E
MTEIKTSNQGQTLVLRLNRPEKMNAITRDMYAGLATQLNQAAENPDIRCVLITSEGDHFTAGNDIRDFMSNPPTEGDSGVAKFLGSLLEFPKPLLAAVKGNAIGVGTTMLLHCDVVVASPSANFSMPFTSLGLVPEAGSTKLLPDLIGYQRAAKIFMTGESFGADEALEMGLIAEIDADAESKALAIAEKIAQQPPNAILNTKALMKAGSHDAVAAVMLAEFQLFSLALQSEEAADAFMKFMSTRGK